MTYSLLVASIVSTSSKRTTRVLGQASKSLRRNNYPAPLLATLLDPRQFFSSSAGLPSTVKAWEKLANKELARDKVDVDWLRTHRVTPEGIQIQPVYWDLDAENPDMPGVYPYTRGPYATMYTNRPWTVRKKDNLHPHTTEFVHVLFLTLHDFSFGNSPPPPHPLLACLLDRFVNMQDFPPPKNPMPFIEPI
jgi:hypothetical protein